MAELQRDKEYKENTKNNDIGGAQDNMPDAETQNDTGYAGTTNAVSEDRRHRDGYKLAIEDTMIGYDGNDEQMDMDIRDEDDIRRSGKSGIDDNS